jgi:phosphoadenosine phosphosulfate reductase
VVTVEPEQTVAEQDADQGPGLYTRNPDRCCFLRKVLPLDRALAGYDAWASGLRRDDSPARSRTPVVDWDRRNGLVKVNPLARWTQRDVDEYVDRRGVLVNPLRSQGSRPWAASRAPAPAPATVPGRAGGPAPARPSAASTWTTHVPAAAPSPSPR